jgi:parvulin-like peptidyl-prolyl isomerase
MNKALLAICAVLTAAALAGCGGITAGKTLATVNGRAITSEQFFLKAKLYGLEIKTQKEASEFLNLLINDELVLQQAKTDRIELSSAEIKDEMESFAPDYDSAETKKALKDEGIRYSTWIKDLHEKILRKKVISTVMKDKIKIQPDEVKDYYWSNLMDFRKFKRVHALQIVLDSEEKAKQVQQLIMRGDKFEALAEKYSSTSEGKNGGDLGYFGEKEMPAFINDAVFSMKKGEISGIVKSPYGWHIFKVLDVQEADTPKYEDVKQEVYDRYYDEKKDEYFKAWMQELRKAAGISVNEKNLKEITEEVKQ